MAYTLQRLAADSHDLILDGSAIGSVVRTMSARGRVEGWIVELQDGAGPVPAPFHQGSHEFRTLDDASRWLGIPPTAGRN